MMATANDVLTFWLDQTGPAGWYNGDAALDADIKRQFEETLRNACEGALSLWLTYPSGALAYIILTDQFSRNMYRDAQDAFRTDGIARSAAKAAIAKGWDLRIDPPARQFFYMPLMHSECLADQDRAVRLIKTRLSESDGGNLLHARAHREVIRRFGRFPSRNAALGRDSSSEEQAYLSTGAYGRVVRDMQAAEVA